MSKQEAEKWLNDIIKAQNKLRLICGSKVDLGLDTISIPDEIHMFSGIEMLADALGIELTVDEHWFNDGLRQRGRKYFYYNKHEVFQIYTVAEVSLS